MNESIDRAKNEINNEPYNMEFSIIELERVLMTLKNTAPGIDEISNVLLKQLPTNIKQELLDVVNQSYISGNIPIEWKTGLVVPILKPGKPPESASSYRPVTLLACIGKVMERMVQKRLEYVAEEKDLMHEVQSGFRKGQGAIDVLLRVENHIRQL